VLALAAAIDEFSDANRRILNGKGFARVSQQLGVRGKPAQFLQTEAALRVLAAAAEKHGARARVHLCKLGSVASDGQRRQGLCHHHVLQNVVSRPSGATVNALFFFPEAQSGQRFVATRK
jgi:hypothetical protein